jgi:geranylgeranyl pyrophosphate synthase
MSVAAIDVEAAISAEVTHLLRGFELPTRLEKACAQALHNSGKAFRPRLLTEVAACRPISPDPAGLARALVSVELLHLASLLHDDVVDRATLRRGEPAIRCDFGDTASVLAGGWFVGRSVGLLCELGQEAVRAYAEAVAEMCDGEMLEIEDLYDLGRSPQRYFAAIERKTAAVFALAGRLGWVIGGLDRPALAHVEAFARELGVLFQLVDDLLDLYSPTEQTGKERGSDLRQGVYTLPVIYALERSAALRAACRSPIGAADVAGLAELVRASGGLERALSELEQHANRARAAVDSLPNQQGLTALLEELVGRCDDLS